MNAAKRRHALVHAKAVAWLVYYQPDYHWLIDLDVHVVHADQAFILKPDIVGEDKAEGRFKVFVEVSDATLQKDLNQKFDVYAHQGIEFYIVVDCRHKVIRQYKNTDGTFSEADVFENMSDIFKDGMSMFG